MIYDVTIVGGGPAGAATALALASGGAKVMLIEARPEPVWKIGETLAPSARPFLGALGLLDRLTEDGHHPSPGNCSVWGSTKPVETDFIFNPHGGGWQLDRVRFERSLLETAAAAGADVRRGILVQCVQRKSAAAWEIQTSAGSFRALWLVDATGRRSSLTRAVAGPRTSLDRLVSIYTVASTTELSDRRTWIEAVPDGWWYTAVTPGARRTVAFQTDATLLRMQEWRRLRWFESKVAGTTSLAHLLARSRSTFLAPPQITSAESTRRRHPCGQGWVAVGDAALSFDPLSGSGLSKALESATRAAALIADPSPAALHAYTCWIEDSWQAFMRLRRDYYTQETRWPHHPFWHRLRSER